MSTLALIISDTFIRQDAENRYCLNDLHNASGGEAKNKPSEWLRNKQTTELIEEISKAGIPALEGGIPASKIQPVLTINGGNQPGTYVVKELVYAYAMWISPKFHLQVIRAYDALVTSNGSFEQDFAQLHDRLYHAQEQIIGLLAEKLALMEKSVKPKPRAATPDETKAIIRCRAEGYAHADIAELLGRTADSVQKIIARCKRQGGAL